MNPGEIPSFVTAWLTTSIFRIIETIMTSLDTDPRRPGRIVRCSKLSSIVDNDASEVTETGNDDLMSDYMNVLGMVFSMCALMLRVKWCAWVAIYCSCISFANTKYSGDTKQIMSSFMLSISSVAMSYLQNPTPMTMSLQSS